MDTMEDIYTMENVSHTKRTARKDATQASKNPKGSKEFLDETLLKRRGV
jgi:hypothetical protein